jgi:NADH-quinone oxidoreductase subunit J
MEGDLIAFIALAGISIAAALMVVEGKEIFHAGLFLALNLITVGALFFLLTSEFLGAIQILVYGGAVIVLVLFAIILTRKEGYSEAIPVHSKFLRAVIMVVVLFAILSPLLSSPAVLKMNSLRAADLKLTYAIGYYLFTDYVIPFEIVGLALLAALLGGIALIRLYKRGGVS